MRPKQAFSGTAARGHRPAETAQEKVQSKFGPVQGRDK
jgi:hypothetical protein